MIRYKVKINFIQIYNMTPLEFDCRYIEFDNTSVKLLTTDFMNKRITILKDIESIEVKPYVYNIR